jgi:hypothetical protein
MIGGPVMLATLAGAPLDEGAVDLALAVARDHDARLVLVDVEDHPGGGRGTCPGFGVSVFGEIAERAVADGVPVTTLVGRSVRPITALVEAAAAERPRLLVFGPDPGRLSAWRHLSRRRYRRAVGALERRTSCLLWAADADRGMTAVTVGAPMSGPAWPARRGASTPWPW